MNERRLRVGLAIGSFVASSISAGCGSDDPMPLRNGVDASATDAATMHDASTDAASVDGSSDAGNRSVAFGIDANDALVRISLAAPGTVSTTAITGLATNETILGIDVRPSNGKLYAVGSASRLYTIDTTSGAATLVGPGAFTPMLSGLAFGVDFNPVVDRIRIESESGQNFRLHPDTGAVAAADTALSYAIGDANHGIPPHVTGNAYATPVTVDGGAASVLYALDTALDVLAIQSPPDSGTLTTIGALGIDLGDRNGFDIRVESGIDQAYVAAAAGGGASSDLYTINLQTGSLTLIGAVGGAALRAFALTP